MIIEWSMRLFDNDQELVKREKHETKPGGYYAGHPELFARHQAENWFELDKWDEWLGMDSGDGEVIVEIHEPEEMRGKWRVQLELEVAASETTKIVEEKTL